MVDKLGIAFEKNHRAYVSAISALDGHVQVLRATLNDVCRDLVQTTDALVQHGIPIPERVTVFVKEGVSASGGEITDSIDWAVYYSWYNQHVEQEKAAAAEPTSAIVTPSEAAKAEEVFGGDYGGD